MGCDTHCLTLFFRFSYFNPRTHVGCDIYTYFVVNSLRNFNPRTHVGCDRCGGVLCLGVGISIHAPTWGATYGH